MTDLRASAGFVVGGGRRPTRVRQRRWAPRFAVYMWERNRVLLGNAGSLAATTGITSITGFAYWAVAARMFSQGAVGYGSASISAMTMLGTVGMLGLGTLLMGELPRSESRTGLIAAALLTSAIGSAILGLLFSLVTPLMSSRFEDLVRSPGQTVIFILGVVFTGVTLVYDQATIGLLRGDLQLKRNLVFSIVKLVIMPGVALVLHDRFGVGITLSWLIGMVVSLGFIAARSGKATLLGKPEWRVLRGLGKTTLAHNWLNLSIAIPRSLIPVLVTVIVSPTANAAFYVAWMLSGFLYIIPTHLSTVLFAMGSAEPRIFARKLRFTLRLSLLIGFPVMLVLAVFAEEALRVFGTRYAVVAGTSLVLLAIGYVPLVPKLHYIAVARATGHIPRAAALMTVSGVMEVVAAVLGGKYDGLDGLTLALVGVFMLEGLVTAPPVVRTAVTRGRHRLGDRLSGVSVQASLNSVVGAPDLETPAVHFPEDIKRADRASRQEEGMAMLLSIAKSVGFESGIRDPGDPMPG